MLPACRLNGSLLIKKGKQRERGVHSSATGWLCHELVFTIIALLHMRAYT